MLDTILKYLIVQHLTPTELVYNPIKYSLSGSDMNFENFSANEGLMTTLLIVTKTKFAVDEVVACPAPMAPDITLPIPSSRTPLLTACAGGGGA